MRRLSALTLGLLGLGASLGALPQNPPTPPPRPTVQAPPIQGGGRAGVPAQPPPPLVTTGLVVGRVIDPGTGTGVAAAIVTLNGGPTRTQGPTLPGARPTPIGPPPPPPQILTDGEGRFAFTSLTRGNYSLTAARTGYAQGAYGRLRPNGPTRQLQLDDGEKVGDVTLRLFKYGSITGTLVDDAGEPVVSAMIRVYRRGLVSGRRVLMPFGGVAQTDDRGMYRMGNLTPGDYVVLAPFVPVSAPGSQTPGGARPNFQATMQGVSSGASPIPGGGGQAIGADTRFLLQRSGGVGDVAAAADPSGRVSGFATMYYPGTATANAAQLVTVTSGEERSGIDIALHRVPTFNVSGQVLATDGPAGDFVVRLVRTDTGEIVQEPESAVAMTDATGSFMFMAVPSGQYVAQVVRVPRPGPAEAVRIEQLVTFQATPQPGADALQWAMAPVSVSDTDVHGITLTMREGLTISGRLEFSGNRPRPEAQRLTQIPVVVEPAEGFAPQYNSGPPSRVQSDGRFVTSGQLPGRYIIRIGGAPAGWYVQTIAAGGLDVTESPIELSTGSVNNVVITFTDQTQDLRGTVTGNPNGADPPAVVVFPADTSAWKNFGFNPARMRIFRTSATSVFTFASLPAGDYYLVAIPEEYSSEWQDTAYLEALSRAATRVALAPGERKSIDVTVQDVKPPGIGRLPAPVSLASDLDVSGDVDRVRGPFVIDDESPQVRDARTATPVGGGSISGIVTIDEGSPRPARFARVSVRTSTVPGERIAMSDGEGRYTVTGLTPGNYQVVVTKPAYLSMTYGARRPVTSPGSMVHVEAGQAVTGINVMLRRGGVVTGTIIGADGEPASGVRVQLLQRTIADGETRLLSAASLGQAVTDDRGTFRLFGIRPGTYSITAIPQNTTNVQSEIRQLSDQELRAAFSDAAAKPRSASQTSAAPRTILPAPPGPLPSTTPAGRPIGFSPVYYPGTAAEEDAGFFSVASGAEMRITLGLQMVPTARLEGTVTTAEGQPATMSGLQLTLTRSATYAASSSSVRMTENGVFQAMGVAPGRYLLMARFTQQEPRPAGAPGTPVQPNQWFAQQEIDVVGVDVSGINLTLAPPLSITGKVVFEGGTPPGPETQVQVRLDSAGRTPGASLARVIRPTDGGAFTITGVTPGRYRLNASVITQVQPGGPAATPSPWAVKTAAIDGRDAMEAPVDIQMGRPPQGAVVTMTTRLPQLSATITDQSGKPVPNMAFVLFSTNRDHWTGSTSRRVRSQLRPNDEGVYQFVSILPGEYYLAVLTDIEPTDLYDPQFLEQVIPAAIKLTLAEGDKKTQNLRIAGGSSNY